MANVDTIELSVEDLADWADTWAYENGVDYGPCDDYGLYDLIDDFCDNDITTKEEAMEFVMQMAMHK